MSQPAPLYLKLGGSLITDKRTPETVRADVLARVAGEIAQARAALPDQPLILGHGSGSFGHVVGRTYGTRAGVRTPEQWYGFAATADAAARLNRLVTAALLAARLPAWSIQPSAALHCRDGVVTEGPLFAVVQALAHGLLPVLYGDVALDAVRGGTIASTEEIFTWLARHLPPRRIVLAGEVDGLFNADPLRDPAAQRIPHLTRAGLPALAGGLGGSHGVDVTGGMAAKVELALRLAEQQPGLEVIICSGLEPGHILRALTEAQPAIGTRITAE